MSDSTAEYRRSFNITRQLEHYVAAHKSGNSGVPLSVEVMEEGAKARMSAENYEWVAGSAGNGDAARENVRAFDRWKIMPRMLCDISDPDISVEILGKRFSSPILIAPIGVQQAAHVEGELATARGAAAADVPMVVSTVSTFSLEEVAAAAPGGRRWYQLYWSSDPELNRSLLARAKAAGYEAVVVTLDTQRLGWREGNLQHGFLPFLNRTGVANYMSDPAFRSHLPREAEECTDAEIAKGYFDVFSDLSHTWDDLQEIRGATDLPIWVKGLQHPDDVEPALGQGMDGIIVSNHGGRQVAGGISTLDALPEIFEKVGGRCPILLDSGIRRGADVFKTIALGADAVLLGRPFMWALAIGGAEGVHEYLQNFLADLELNMTLAGRACVGEICRDDLRRVS